MHVIFVEPGFPDNQREFVRALVQVGARVTGIGERDLSALDGDLQSWLHGYWRIGSVVDEGALEWAVRSIQAQEWVDRLEATVEAHILPVAHVRERCTIPGTSARTAWLCRDKPSMKQVLAEAGIPTAQTLGSGSAEEIRAFADQVGYPLIVKPRAGAGASGTSRVDDESELLAALQAAGVGGGGTVAIEEFIEGHEGFWDTLTVNGEVAHEFISHYYPGVLEAMRTRWISPQIVATNQVDDPRYAEVREMGRRVLAVLDIETSATHMEWFFGPRGLKFSEIGCRPPGVSMWDVYSFGNDLDLYREWAQLIVHGHTEARASRRFAAGMIALRPTQDGHIAGYEGLEGLQAEFGADIVDSHFPPPGTPTQGVEAGYKANAWVRARHADYDHLRFILDEIGRRAKVIAR
ncbi:MAG: ATP-grasp domain-containing protein [Acidimicrobiia bacterium]|nr:ATP-grasp domain-containing protein [Acidimicrobiia bacterium]